MINFTGAPANGSAQMTDSNRQPIHGIRIRPTNQRHPGTSRENLLPVRLSQTNGHWAKQRRNVIIRS
ncbi:MAG TPA: hypothetical protein VM511_13810 [Luteolibacter sp.]|nr:hypothetical protein [Luteolibacter sp.]